MDLVDGRPAVTAVFTLALFVRRGGIGLVQELGITFSRAAWNGVDAVRHARVVGRRALG